MMYASIHVTTSGQDDLYLARPATSKPRDAWQYKKGREVQIPSIEAPMLDLPGSLSRLWSGFTRVLGATVRDDTAVSSTDVTRLFSLSRGEVSL